MTFGKLLNSLYLGFLICKIGIIIVPGASLVAQWLRIHLLGFPGGAVVKNPPASAGDTGSSPGLGRFHVPWSSWARVPQLLSLSATTAEACVPRAHALRQERLPNGKPTHRNEE